MTYPAASTKAANCSFVTVVGLIENERDELRGHSSLVARLTRRSAHDLNLTPGQIVYAQIKAVALIG